MKLFYWRILIVVLLLAACNPGREGEGLVVEDAWARPTPAGAQNAAFYMTITNNSGQEDTLQAVHVDACGAVELHRTAVDENGVMQMRPVEGQTLPIRAGETVQFAAGGLHVMCLDVARPLEAGQEIPLTLLFEKAGEIVVDAAVREEAP